MLKYIVILLVLFSSAAFGKLPDPKDNPTVTEAKSVDRDQCVDGSCSASAFNVRLTESRPQDAETARRMSSETKGKKTNKTNPADTSK